ncbi:cytochrome c oxidase assembly protein, partial [Xanthomonas perforans]|nr:cytochrome c oxidase assembly protein [Xanthomonas perforans]
NDALTSELQGGGAAGAPRAAP